MDFDIHKEFSMTELNIAEFIIAGTAICAVIFKVIELNKKGFYR